MTQKYSLIRDPVYYITVGCFGILTTSLPALLGQPRFLPIAQSLTLFIFVLIPLRRQNVTSAAYVLGIWLILQFVIIATLTSWTMVSIERAIPNGFATRGETLAWLFGAVSYPFGIAGQPLRRIAELTGMIVGSAVTAGLAGAWFLVRTTNLAAFECGVLINGLNSAGGYALATLPWNLLRISAYACLLLLFSQLLLVGTTSLSATLHRNRRLALTAVTLTTLALLGEWMLPTLWQRFARALV